MSADGLRNLHPTVHTIPQSRPSTKTVFHTELRFHAREFMRSSSSWLLKNSPAFRPSRSFDSQLSPLSQNSSSRQRPLFQGNLDIEGALCRWWKRLCNHAGRMMRRLTSERKE